MRSTILRPGVAGLDKALDTAQRGGPLESAEALALADAPEERLDDLCAAAATLRDQGKGRVVTFSPKVFIPLTRLCRDFCGYCTFRQDPASAGDQLYMTQEQVLAVAQHGEKLGCTEALFTLGERPELRYPEAQQWLNQRGYRTTLAYLAEMCRLVAENTRLLPHANPGTMSRHEMEALRPWNASMGLMLESASLRLHQTGGPHELAPSKRPRVRLRTIELAGELGVAFTTGILIGIGETRRERVEALLAIRELHRRFGHVQEVIIQNFRAKPGTPMAQSPDAGTDDLRWTVAVARLLLGPGMNLQVPPNLSAQDYPVYLNAGINDWGGISPLTIDYVNPEAPWPAIAELRRRSAALGFELRPRLPVYPEYVSEHRAAASRFLPQTLHAQVSALADNQGYVKGGIARYAGCQ